MDMEYYKPDFYIVTIWCKIISIFNKIWFTQLVDRSGAPLFNTQERGLGNTL